MQYRAYCGIRTVSEDMVRCSLVGSRSLEDSSTLGILGLEGLLLFVHSNLFTSGLISTWRVVERFFAEFFGFLFDNMS